MSTKKSLVTLACAGVLFSIVNAPSTFADDGKVNTDAVVTVTETKPSEPTVPSADSVDTGNKAPETPAVPVPSKDDKGTETPVIPPVPSTEDKKPSTEEVKPSTEETKPSTEETKPSTEDKKPSEVKPEETKPSTEDKKDYTNLPVVDPTVPDTKPIETNKGTVTGTDNGKVIVKDASTGEERKVAPEELGGKVEKDGTVTIKEKDGKITRLPNTGVEESIPMVVTGITMLTSGFGFLKRPRRKD